MSTQPRVELALGPRTLALVTTVVAGNLGLGLDDDEAALARRTGLAAVVGRPVAFARQVHGAHVVRIGGTAGLAARPDGAPVADGDALVSADGVPVAVVVADCVPVLLADGRGVVGAVHAGRRGVLAGVVGAAVSAMLDAGARAGDLRAVVGPAVCGACYEVPAALRDEVAAVVPVAAATTSWGTPALDLPAAVRAQLEAAGVTHVADTGACTLTDRRWFSHRAATAPRAGEPARPVGRVAAVVASPGVSQQVRGGAGLA